ncbi:MAG: glutaredoxin family protein [Anaerolineales bacterium]
MDAQADQGKLIVYGRQNCGQAVLLARCLRESGIEFEWRDILEGEPRFQAELRQLADGHLSVPTIIFPDGAVFVEQGQEVMDRLGLRRPSFFERCGRIGEAIREVRRYNKTYRNPDLGRSS